jgi:DNA-binding response OmpR family regulator
LANPLVDDQVDVQRCHVQVDAAGFQVMGIGARVAATIDLLSSWGFNCRSTTDASAGMAALQQAPVHLLLVELEPTGGLGVEMAKLARLEQVAGAVLLVDEPLRAQQLVAALARGGFDGYVPLPAEPNLLLRLVENALLAQLAPVQTARVVELEAAYNRNNEQVVAIDTSLRQERARTTTLQKEVASLRGQLDAMHLVAGRPRSTEGVPVTEQMPAIDLHRTITRSVAEMPLMEQATLGGIDLEALLRDDDDDPSYHDDPPTQPGLAISEHARQALRAAAQPDATVRMPVRAEFAKDLWEQATQMSPSPVVIPTDEVDFLDED